MGQAVVGEDAGDRLEAGPRRRSDIDARRKSRPTCRSSAFQRTRIGMSWPCLSRLAARRSMASFAELLARLIRVGDDPVDFHVPGVSGSGSGRRRGWFPGETHRSGATARGRVPGIPARTPEALAQVLAEPALQASRRPCSSDHLPRRLRRRSRPRFDRQVFRADPMPQVEELATAGPSTHLDPLDQLVGDRLDGLRCSPNFGLYVRDRLPGGDGLLEVLGERDRRPRRPGRRRAPATGGRRRRGCPATC